MIELLKTKIKDPCGPKEKMKEMAKEYSLPVQVEEPKIVEGWVGILKGTFQILFKRGWLDPTNLDMYTKNRKQGMDGIQYSIKKLMEKQEDFIQELTLLQYHTPLIDVYIERTLKFHPEIAGEGIEYDWALPKTAYRRIPKNDKN